MRTQSAPRRSSRLVGGFAAAAVALAGVFAAPVAYAVSADIDAEDATSLEASAVSNPAPVVVVSQTEGFDPESETLITVTGSGFVQTAETTGTRPPLAGKFTGVYLAFGSYLDEWQPTVNAPAAARSNIDTRWVVPAESMDTIGGERAGAVELKEDGTFTATLKVTKDEAKTLAEGNYGVVTYPGGGAKYAPYETFTPITFAEPLPVPTVTVSQTEDLDPSGETLVTVSGAGFLPNAPATSGTRPPLAGKFTGVYVAFGSYLDVWQPSADAPSAARSNFDTKWAVPAESIATIGGERAGAVELKEDGSFTTTLKITNDEAKTLAEGNYGVVTYPGGGAKYAPFETFTAVSFAEVVEPVVPPTAEVNPGGSSSVETGDPVRFVAGEFAADVEFVRVEIHSDPIVLGVFPVVDGWVTVDLDWDALPAGFSGEHSVVFIPATEDGEALAGQEPVSATFTVATAPVTPVQPVGPSKPGTQEPGTKVPEAEKGDKLPDTGAVQAPELVAMALLAMFAGAGLMLARRRRVVEQ